MRLFYSTTSPYARVVRVALAEKGIVDVDRRLTDPWNDEPELLAAEMERLRRCAHRVFWLNPLKAHEGYEPLTRGMQAALEHIDDFMPAHNLRSLEDLAAHLRHIDHGHHGDQRHT